MPASSKTDVTFNRETKIINDWKEFLEERKKEFVKQMEGQKSKSIYEKNDFDFIQELGSGAFGMVILAQLKSRNKMYAIKRQEKEKLVKAKVVKHVLNEKRILQALNHPFTVFLEFSFQDNVYLFLGLPFVEGGEMFKHLRRMRYFPEDLSKFYGAQVLLALEYLHFCDMVYRDLKPENLLVDPRGYVKVTDFGFCKVIKDRTYTFCGTPEYLAPEIITSKGYGKSVDWWAFGVLLYEMSAGYTPFQTKDTMKTYEKIVSRRYSFPKRLSVELKHLISNILQVDLTRRYGNLKNGINDIKNHSWFAPIKWLSLLNYRIKPLFVPETQNDLSKLMNSSHSMNITFKTKDKDPYKTIFQDF